MNKNKISAVSVSQNKLTIVRDALMSALPVDQTVCTPRQIAEYLADPRDTSNPVYDIVNHSIEAVVKGGWRYIPWELRKRDELGSFKADCWIWINEELRKGIAGKKKSSYDYTRPLDAFLRTALADDLLKLWRKYWRNGVSRVVNVRKRDLARPASGSEHPARWIEDHKDGMTETRRNVACLLLYFYKIFEYDHGREPKQKEIREALGLPTFKRCTLKMIDKKFGKPVNFPLDPDVFGHDKFETGEFGAWYWRNSAEFKSWFYSNVKYEGPVVSYPWDSYRP